MKKKKTTALGIRIIYTGRTYGCNFRSYATMGKKNYTPQLKKIQKKNNNLFENPSK